MTRTVITAARLVRHNERDVKANPTNAAGRYKPTSEFVGFVRRSIRALARRVGEEGDIDALPAMLAMRAHLDEQIRVAVQQLRADPYDYSWADIGARLGMSKQSAAERFGRPGTTGGKTQ